jgi:lipopolysaccharide/colanic/teichoic acid biosynthesis glycosyltransferase
MSPPTKAPKPIGDILPPGRQRKPLEQELFLRTLNREACRSERTGEVLSMVVLGCSKAKDFDQAQLLDYLQRRLRLTDEIGWLQKDFLAILLPATTPREAAIVAHTIAMALGEAHQRFSCRLYSNAGQGKDMKPLTEEELEAATAEANGKSDGDAPQSSAIVWNLKPEDLSPLFMVPMHWSKRALDILGAAVLLIFTSPIMLFTALAIRLESWGPVIFRQERVGHGGKPFSLLKFRSMVQNAEELQDKLMKQNLRDGPAFKIHNDPRITRVGRFIRATGIDELPQLVNVLRGDMTLVGPRPPLPSEVLQYEAWQKARLRMVGGLTCIWQVDGRLRNVSFREWMRMDIRYGNQFSATDRMRSTTRDIGLIARTAWVVLFGRGDR